MGLFDFFQSRENDFVKLESTSVFGLKELGQPVIILYNAPSGIRNDEIRYMVEDGAPKAYTQRVKIQRLSSSDLDSADMDTLTVKEVLQKAIGDEKPFSSSSSDNDHDDYDDITKTVSVPPSYSTGIPIIYFSGISNEEMMQTYNIIGQEIYEETGGMMNAACAKAVKPAMDKSFRQLVEEITGDHTDAMQSGGQ
jgi:hypothetical protein